jgi:hypothetical protein
MELSGTRHSLKIRAENPAAGNHSSSGRLQGPPSRGRDEGVGNVVDPIVPAREDPARMDHARVSRLFADLGPEAAEAVVTRALEELAVRLFRLDRMWRAGELSRLRKTARGMAAIADELGMAALARVALDVTACVDAGDRVALAAVLARLDRLGERSLLAVWDEAAGRG